MKACSWSRKAKLYWRARHRQICLESWFGRLSCPSEFSLQKFIEWCCEAALSQKHALSQSQIWDRLCRISFDVRKIVSVLGSTYPVYGVVGNYSKISRVYLQVDLALFSPQRLEYVISLLVPSPLCKFGYGGTARNIRSIRCLCSTRCRIGERVPPARGEDWGWAVGADRRFKEDVGWGVLLIHRPQ